MSAQSLGGGLFQTLAQTGQGFTIESHQPSGCVIYPQKVPDERGSSTCLTCVTHLPLEGLEVVKDERWVTLFSELFNAASSICSIIGTGASKFVPYLGFIIFPITLYHAVQASKERFRLVVTAYKCSRFADMFFWAGRGVGSFGNVINEIVKPFAGGLTIFGLSQIPALSFAVSFVIPIVLIVFSTIGGVSQGCALGRSARALHTFEKKRAVPDNSLDSLEDLFKHMNQFGAAGDPESELEAKNFSDACFMSDIRQQLIQERIKSLLNFDAKASFIKVQEAMSCIIPVIQDGYQTLSLEPTQDESSTLHNIETTINLCDQLLVTPVCQIQKSKIGAAVKALQTAREELQKFKNNLYEEGLDITDTTHFEIQRKLAEQTLNVIAAAIILAVGILWLALPQEQMLIYALSLSSSAISVLNVILNKGVGYKRYQPTDRFLTILRKREELETEA